MDGPLDGSLGLGGEVRASASFLRRNGHVWTTDKDSIVMGLLAAEMTARCAKDPGEIYHALTEQFGAPVYQRIDARANAKQKALLAKLSPQQVSAAQTSSFTLFVKYSTIVQWKSPAHISIP
jgi:phosphoglucomutase